MNDFNWQLTVQVTDTDALGLILKETDKFKVVGNIVNLMEQAIPVLEHVPPQARTAPTSVSTSTDPDLFETPSGGRGRGTLKYGSRTVKSVKMKEIIVSSIKKGRNKFSEMMEDFTKKGGKSNNFQGTLESLKKGGFIIVKERGVYDVTDQVNEA